MNKDIQDTIDEINNYIHTIEMNIKELKQIIKEIIQTLGDKTWK